MKKLIKIIIASAPPIGAFSVGGAIGFPNILLQQLQVNGTSFNLDLDTSSWIGSIHGLAGIPSILMPTFMQWKGRKPAFLVCCLCVILGWILVLFAKTTTTILISECFLGLGGNSLITVSFCSLSEMLDPKFRNMFIVVYGSTQALGISSAGILGQYFHWKTVSSVYLISILLSFINAIFLWPESPAWLALKNRFSECEKTFLWLRGDSSDAQKELFELRHINKENVKKGPDFRNCLRKDFYVPAMLMFVLLNMSYWTGETVVMIYATQIIKKTSGNDLTASNGLIILDVLLFVCHVICIGLIKRFNNKSLVALCTFGTILSMIFCSVVTYLQSVGSLDKSPLCLYGLIAFITLCNLGLSPIVFAVAMEIMPVKHRGIGGALYIFFISCLHTSSLKAAPYLFIEIDFWGTFLLYAINATICLAIVCIYLPETKNRTLQELEDYFNYGKFIKRADNCDVQVPIILSAHS
ncbi:hypothetical protein K1T71_005747 [Dendrolimus kikuchii]|uniref:Uncharacterized protein n=1 Tax=Dendrolimus kikuchii TaxID=765133 RepID=A0ACC1D6E3_9NEOP|nr:hypothetical protein K1T71_005747 [Dendrolimus kikuchii]